MQSREASMGLPCLKPQNGPECRDPKQISDRSRRMQDVVSNSRKASAVRREDGMGMDVGEWKERGKKRVYCLPVLHVD